MEGQALACLEHTMPCCPACNCLQAVVCSRPLRKQAPARSPLLASSISPASQTSHPCPWSFSAHPLAPWAQDPKHQARGHSLPAPALLMVSHRPPPAREAVHPSPQPPLNQQGKPPGRRCLTSHVVHLPTGRMVIGGKVHHCMGHIHTAGRTL
jgi:hypothetical protein